MSVMRLLRTKRQRQFLIAYLAWVLVLFVVYWTEPYGVSERWYTFMWLTVAPAVLFVLLFVRDVVGSGMDLYRCVRNWVNRGV